MSFYGGHRANSELGTLSFELCTLDSPPVPVGLDECDTAKDCRPAMRRLAVAPLEWLAIWICSTIDLVAPRALVSRLKQRRRHILEFELRELWQLLLNAAEHVVVQVPRVVQILRTPL